MEGVVVTAKRHGSTIATSVISDADGRYYFPAGRLQVGPQTLSVRAIGYDVKALATDVCATSRWRPFSARGFEPVGA